MTIEEYINHIPAYLRRRGLNYYKEERILNVSYNENSKTFVALIEGTKDYTTKVTINNDKVVKSSCTCPVDGLCKHEVALLYYLLENKVDHLSVPTINMCGITTLCFRGIKKCKSSICLVVVS